MRSFYGLPAEDRSTAHGLPSVFPKLERCLSGQCRTSVVDTQSVSLQYPLHNPVPSQ